MELVNATMDASQVASLIEELKNFSREFNFENIILRTDAWDDALAPFNRLRNSEIRKQEHDEAVDVPKVLSPAGIS
jgi:hypothetical protein